MAHEEDYEDYDYEGEQYAEFVSSWVSGGGLASEADRAWRSGIAHRNGYGSAPEVDYESERPSWIPVYGSEEWEAQERAFEERDYLDEMGGF